MVKPHLVLIAMFCAAIVFSGISHGKPSDEECPAGTIKLYPTSLGDLNIRSAPNLKAPVVGQTSYGRFVCSAPNSGAEELSTVQIAGVKGRFSKVRFGEIDGYVFDGFLSPKPPPLYVWNSGGVLYPMPEQSAGGVLLELGQELTPDPFPAVPVGETNTLNGRTGQFVRVKSKQGVGFVHSSIVSRLPLKSLPDQPIDYLNVHFKPSSKPKLHKYCPYAEVEQDCPKQKDFKEYIEAQTFYGGIKFSENISFDCYLADISVPHISLNEGFLLAIVMKFDSFMRLELLNRAPLPKKGKRHFSSKLTGHCTIEKDDQAEKIKMFCQEGSLPWVGVEVNEGVAKIHLESCY